MKKSHQLFILRILFSDRNDPIRLKINPSGLLIVG